MRHWRWLLILLVASVTIVAFYESWMALVNVARRIGIYDPHVWPWLIDGFIIIMAVMVALARAASRSVAIWFPRLGLLAATALSTSIQAIYAPQHEDWVWVWHSWTPVALLIAFEGLVLLVFGVEVKAKDPNRVPLAERVHGQAKAWSWIMPAPRPVPDPLHAGTGTAPAPLHDGTAPAPLHDGTAPAPLHDGTAPVPAPASLHVGTAGQDFTGPQKRRVKTWVKDGKSIRWMAGELGLTDSERQRKLGPLVKEMQESMNGSRPKEDVTV